MRGLKPILAPLLCATARFAAAATVPFSFGEVSVACEERDGWTGCDPSNVVRTVALVMPASILPKADFDCGRDRLEAAGFKVKVMPRLDFEKVAPVADRVADLEQAWMDSEVDLVLCVRGGTGAEVAATDAAGFNSDVAFNGNVLKVGAEATTIGDFTYQLAITDNSELALTIAAKPVPPTPTD